MEGISSGTVTLKKESYQEKNLRKEPFYKNKKFQIFGMLLPTLIMIIAFGIYPILYVLYYSFTDFNGITSANFVGLENYIRVFEDEMWWLTVKNTFQIGLVVSLIQVPLALFLAVLLNKSFRGRDFFRATIFLPCVTSTAIMGVIFYFLFSSYNGIVNSYLIDLGLITKPISWFGKGLLSKGVVTLFLLWHDVGFFMLLFLAALQKIPGEVYESAKIDGAGVISTFFKITLPMLGKMFQIVSALSIVNALKLFDSVKSLTNGGPGGDTEVMTMYIFSYFFESTGVAQQGYASAVSIVATIIVTLVVVLYSALTKKMDYESR